MKMNILKPGLFALAATSLLAACKGGASGSFNTDSATGIQYRFIKHDENGKKPAEGDFAHVVMVYKDEKDSTLYTTRARGDSAGAIQVPLNKTFHGCLEQGILMMATGDSASFKISADSLWLKTFHQKKLPPSIKPGTILTFYVKLLGFMNKDEAQKAQMAKMQQQQKEMMQRRMDEWPSINDYLAKNHITAKPDKDSIVYIKRIAGKGRAIHEGDSIYVSYNGTLLNGTVFDKSTPQNPYLKMVYSPGMQLIRGWVIALGSMHEGEQVEMLVPSDLAYGARAMQGIPPFSPLVFDLEVAKVKPAK